MAGPVRFAGGKHGSGGQVNLALFLLLAFLLMAPSLVYPGASLAQESEEAEDSEGNSQENEEDRDQAQLPDKFFMGYKLTPKAGMKANVRSIKYFSDLAASMTLTGASTISSTTGWSWDDYRQQNKTSQKRNQALNYNSGISLPVSMSLMGSWDWSQDKTLNNAGFANEAHRDFKLLNLDVTKGPIKTGSVSTTLTGIAGLKDQVAVNQNIHNDFNESFAGGRIRSVLEISPTLKIAGRAFAKAVGGDRSLGTSTSPSSAVDDTMALRVTFERRYMTGFVSLTRSHFKDEYLDFNRGASGLIDTSASVIDKIVEELKTKDALSLEFDNLTRLGSYGFRSELEHKESDLSYQANGLGRTERSEDTAVLTLFRASDRDSVALKYSYGYKWDDQRIKIATINRGRQFSKDRRMDFYWEHLWFRETKMILKFQQGLSQSIAENAFNANDRDRLRRDFTVKVDRHWDSGFQANMLFAMKSAEDIQIRSTKSSNNNIKDSYEIAPGFNWKMAPWLTLNQSYRVYIQYTDYVFSHFESVNKQDDYNKRGNLNTRVTIRPTSRVTLNIKHDYNQRFNATRTLTDAADNSYYHVDDRQTASKIDLGITMIVAKGITFEGATYNSLDEKERFGTNVTVTENRAGQVWVGTRIARQLGPKSHPLNLAATVKKYNAYGPAVTETSSDYWEADVQLKWVF